MSTLLDNSVESQAEAQKRGLLGPNTLSVLGTDDPNDITIIRPWFRGGNETYCTEFTQQTGGVFRHLMAKACVKLCPIESTAEWLGRRKIVEAIGVQVPELVAQVDRATILEEFIPFTLAQAFARADEDGKAQIHAALDDTAERILDAGFSPLSFHDVRSRGNDMVIIDFGHDLGSVDHHINVPMPQIEALRSSAGLPRIR